MTSKLLAGAFFWVMVFGVVLKMNQDSGLLHLVFCDVGQGDGMLFRLGSTQLLIDSGPDDAMLHCLEKNMPFFDRTIEYAVLTHADHDHIGGMTAVLRNYRVLQVFTPSWGRPTQSYLSLLTELRLQQKHGTVVTSPRVGEEVILTPRWGLKIIAPEVKWGDPNLFYSTTPETELSAILQLQSSDKMATNNGSIGAIMHFGLFSVLLTGDMEKEAEAAALEHNLIPDVNVLKVGHHGAKSSTTIPFVEASRPEISVISAGRNNRYGHPHSQVLDKLKDAQSQIVRTDLLGEIKIVSDGEGFWFKECRYPAWLAWLAKWNVSHSRWFSRVKEIRSNRCEWLLSKNKPVLSFLRAREKNYQNYLF